MKVELLYVDGCHRKTMARPLNTLAAELGLSWTPVLVEKPESALDFQFHGSPSLHVDGADPFATPDTPVGPGAPDLPDPQRPLRHR